MTTPDAVEIKNPAIATIARLAVRDVPGVAALGDGPGIGMRGLFMRHAADRGIRIDASGEGIAAEVFLTMTLDRPVPVVAAQVQQAIRGAIEHATGRAVATVHVVVDGFALAAQQGGLP
jgi:uncharacterized alkaline shock family protein YloU